MAQYSPIQHSSQARPPSQALRVHTTVLLLRRKLCSCCCLLRHAFATGTSSAFPLTSLQCGALLQALTARRSIRVGRQLHAHAVAAGVLLGNTYLATKLCAFYAACGSMGDACALFDRIVLKSSFLWNAMIRGFACCGLSLRALTLYRGMLGFGKRADNYTYPFVLMACGDLFLVEVGTRVHGEVVVCGYESDVYVGNSLVSMYCKFGETETAWKLFDRMRDRDLTSWNTMISGYTKNGEHGKAISLLSLMDKAGERHDYATIFGVLPACAELGALKQGKEIHGYCTRNLADITGPVTNALINVYSSSNFMKGARCLFEKMCTRDIVSWNSLVAGYARHGDAVETLRLFNKLKIDNLMADELTLVAVLRACDQLAALQLGKSLHAYLIKRGFDKGVLIGTALLTIAMVSAYGLHGKGTDAISIFRDMKANGIRADKVAFTSVLSACSHAGLLEEGKDVFNQMLCDVSIKPSMEHYSCMVDLLGRAGLLEEAYKFIMEMEVEPNIDVWAALLSACRVHHNVELAEIAARNAFNLRPQDAGVYVSLSNIYGREKRWDDVERMRRMARQNGLRKSPGCSFVEMGKAIHRFLVGDKSHPQSEYIYAKLEDLRLQLKGGGYVPDTSCVLYDVEEEVKEKMLWDHSERLAIAFALLNTPPQKSIRITKNLRVCGDCHSVTKFISKIVDREIIVRDAHRFHHFQNGACSCSDYW
ncbi:hypothetical protein Taro_045214 [Colocasia esculenta]|uniref:DYW domain-containing protein n=1 Tax=Colocasia esculenta TaxID=4460 RepID=A0A843WW22_COLES|nr:hypothetical protein [Colocasia esculenta]